MIQLKSSGKARLSRKLTRITVLVAVLLGLFLSGLQVTRDYFQQTRALQETIEQIIAVSKPSLIDIAYKIDREGAGKIANGLLQYGFIREIIILDEFDNTLTARSRPSQADSSTNLLTSLLIGKTSKITRLLADPFNPELVYGTLYITVDNDRALQSFYKRSVSVFVFGLLRNVLLSGIFLYIFYLLLTKPLIKIASDLSRVSPESVKGTSIESIPGHKDDELGDIVNAINSFFRNHERHLRQQERAEQELRKQDEQLRAVVQNSVDAIGVSKNGVHTLVNPAYLTMFRYPDENELIGKPIFDLIAKSERRRVARYVVERNSGDRVDSHYETKGLRKDGSEFVMEVNVSQYGPEDDRSTLVILRDVTDKRHLEEQLRHAQKMEAIGTLAGGIAHDFNNILAAIIGYAELAQEDSQPGSPVFQDLERVLEGGFRAKDLVRQILAFSRQAGTECLFFQPVSIVKEAVRMLRPSIPSTVEILVDVKPVTGFIFADPTQIHQVIMNLCTNAYHAMEETGGVLEISLQEVILQQEDIEPGVHPGSFIKLTVCDTGTGISEDVRERIFEPYFTTKKIGKGTGMGLSIVHGLVKSYGGFITLDSIPDKGATFNVFIPVADKAQAQEEFLLEKTPLGSERILLVDDEEILTTMVEDMLQRLGYRVTTRNSSLEALEVFQNQPDQFDLIITDQTMPGMTGSDMARRMMQIRSDIPVILCTGFSDVVSAEKAKAIGIKEFVLKPLTRKDISAVVRRVLDS